MREYLRPQSVSIEERKTGKTGETGENRKTG